METINNKLIIQGNVFVKMLNTLTLYQFISQDGSIQSNAMLSNYFLRALLKLEATESNKYLVLLKQWYLEQSMKGDTINPFLIEGLIMLGLENESDYVKNKINELLNFRYINGRFELPSGYIMQGDLFSTMFTLRIFLYLKNRNQIPQNIYEETIKWILEHNKEIKPAKDKVLPIYLLSLYNFKKYKSQIVKLFNDSHPLVTEKLKRFKSELENNNFNYIFTEIETILWITYDLIPIKGKVNGASTLIKDLIGCIHTFIDIFIKPQQNNINLNDNAIYFTTRQYSLIFSVFSDYYKSQFNNLLKDELLYQNCNNEIENFIKDQIDQRLPYIYTIKEWIKPQLIRIESLAGGYSGSEIIRIYSKLIIPINAQEVPLPNIICKVSETNNFENELNNYKLIPSALKHFFSKSSDIIKYKNEKAFLVMEDLTDFNTLLEISKKEDLIKKTLDDVYNELFHNLRFIYTYKPNIQNNKILHSLYFDDIIRSIGSISKHDFEGKVKYINQLNIIQNSIYQVISEIKEIPATIMHGDLNLRNIMIKSSDDEFRIRFIDLDNFSNAGDYIYDLGELLVDTFISIKDKNVISGLNKFISNITTLLKDNEYEKRLQLSIFRSFLKLSKIKFNRNDFEAGLKYLKHSINFLNNN